MKLVNRSAIALLPTPAMVAWINRVDPEDKVTLAQAQEDPTLFLVSDIQDDEELQEFLEDNFRQMLEVSLEEWFTDHDIWPPLTFKTFQDYFTPRLFTMLADIDDDMPLERDEMPEPEEGSEEEQ